MKVKCALTYALTCIYLNEELVSWARKNLRD